MKRYLWHSCGILIAAMTAVAAPSPTPKPSVNVDLSKVTAEDIRKTEEHRNALLAQQKSELEAEKADHLKVGTALAAATTANLDLQKKVDALNEHANKLQGSLDAANKKLWWYRLHWWGAWVMLGLGVAACLVFAFLKATGRLAIMASKVPGL